MYFANLALCITSELHTKRR